VSGVLQVKNLSYTYSKGTPFEKKALDNVSIEFPEGKIIGLIGHTGCGKSSLVQMLNGLLKPDEGSVFFKDQNIWDKKVKMRDIRFKVGLVFQYPEYQLFEESIYKDIAYGPTNMGLDEKEIRKRVLRAAEFCGITKDMLEKSPFEISGGQKRRVAIAGIMAMEPEVLVLDEPAAGLDPLGREEILGGLWSYQRSTGNTLIIVSHSMEDVAKYTDYTVVMSKSRVFMQSETEKVFSHSEELVKIGLNVPQITELMKYLKANGIDVNDSIFTVENATDELLKKIKAK